MLAQGAALGIGSGVENSNGLKGQNRFVAKNVVSPFQGWADSRSDRIPRADPASGVPPAWAFLFRPLRGGRKAQHQNFARGERNRSRAASFYPAPQKLASRNRPSSSVNSSFSLARPEPARWQVVSRPGSRQPSPTEEH